MATSLDYQNPWASSSALRGRRLVISIRWVGAFLILIDGYVVLLWLASLQNQPIWL